MKILLNKVLAENGMDFDMHKNGFDYFSAFGSDVDLQLNTSRPHLNLEMNFLFTSNFLATFETKFSIYWS